MSKKEKNVLKKIARFFSEYRELGFVIVTFIVALGLQLAGLTKAAHIVLGISAVINVIPLMWGMIQDIRVGTYGVDILAATAIIAALLFGEYWTAMVIVLMLTGGETLEDYAENRAKTELTALLDRAPKIAHVLRGRKAVDIPAREVQAGDKIIIRAGEVVPVDAVVVEGNANFDEASLTGESLPIAKGADAELLSGSVNLDGSVTAKALRAASESQYEQIIKLVKNAADSKAPFVRMADRYSIPFTLLSFTIALGAWAISGESLRFLQVLVVATPCPLILGAPIALISGMSRAAKHGIIIKNGSALERLANVKTLGFDKTGTLTIGQPIVESIETFGTWTKVQVVAAAAALEQNSNHVLANAIVDKAAQLGAKVAKAPHVKEIAGNGLSARVKGQDVLVGRLSLLEKESVAFPKSFSKKSISQTSALVAIDGKLAGIISFKDEIRPEAKTTLERIKKLKVKNILMVTGDNTKTANTIAKSLGIDTVVAEALPADKLIAIEKIKDRPVGFVGDGVNDAPVLTASDVGIALGARGSTAASESADVVIMLDDVSQVATGMEIAQRTFFIAKQSIWTGIILSVILMFIFATGKFPPVYGAALQEIVDVVVIFNALRAHGSWKKTTRVVVAR